MVDNMSLQEVLKENQERTRERLRKQEKENKKTKIIITISSTLIIIMAITILLLLDYNLSQNAYNNCIKNHNQNYCLSKM